MIDIETLTRLKTMRLSGMAEYFEKVATASGDPKLAANWTIGDLAGMLKADGKDIESSPLEAERLGELVGLVAKGELTGKLAKEILPKMYATQDTARAIMEREGLKAMSDTGELEAIIDTIIAASPKQVEQYKGGKTTVIGFFVGQVMKQTRGQANPATVTEILQKRLT